MKRAIHSLHKAFESRIRLGIMSALVVNEGLDFNSLKDYLAVTDGNLASHVTALEKLGYVAVGKQFIGKKPNTRYAATPLGKRAFAEHVAALEKLIRKVDEEETLL